MSRATIDALLRRAMLDPYSPEAANALAGAAKRLKRAGVDLHQPLFVAPITVTTVPITVTPFGNPREIDRLRDENEQLKRKLARASRPRPKKDATTNIDITPIRAAAEYHEAEARRIREALSLLKGVKSEGPPVRPANSSRRLNNQPKFNRQQGDEIRTMLAQGITAAALAKELGVSPATISNVKRMKAGI